MSEMRSRRVGLAIVGVSVAALGAAAPAGAIGMPFVFTADRAVGPLAVGPAARPTLGKAIAAYGMPDKMAGTRGSCTARWSRLQLVGLFTTFGLDLPRACDRRLPFQLARTIGPRWRTDKGVRPGDSVASVRAAYPGASFADWYGTRALALIKRRQFGELSPKVVAVIGSGSRVRSLQIFIGAAGD